MFSQKKILQIDVSTPDIENKRLKMGNLLIFACFFLYTASMSAKGIFTAEVKYIIDMWDLTQAKAQTANAFYFVAYGVVQIVLSMLTARIDIRKYIIATVPVAALFTALMGLATRIEGIWISFGLTGAFQAAIYAGCYYVLATYLPNSLLTKSNKIMNTGYAVGTVVAYALSALCIGFNLWRVPYFIISAIFLFSLIVFAVITKKAMAYKRVNFLLDESILSNSGANKRLFSVKTVKDKVLFYVIVLICAFLTTSLYYAVMNFITSTLVEVHGISQNVSIYVSIIAPIMIAVGPMMTISACEKDHDFIRQGIIFLLIIMPVSVLLALFYKVNVVLYLALAVIFVVLSNGIKAITLSIMNIKMRDQINVAAYSSISNAVASIAAGVAPVIMGAIKDAYGWVACYWVAFGIILFTVCALLIIRSLIVAKQKNLNKK